MVDPKEEDTKHIKNQSTGTEGYSKFTKQDKPTEGYSKFTKQDKQT